MRVGETKQKGEIVVKVTCPHCKEKHEYAVIGEGSHTVICRKFSNRRFQIITK